MAGIIVVFPNRDNAVSIRNLLVRAGMTVTGVCTSGAQAMNYADALDEGIIVCGYKLKDMMYTELRDCLPDSFRVLLVASRVKWEGGIAEGVTGIPAPFKAYELLDTLQGMLDQMEQQRRKRRKERNRARDPKQQAVIGRAKELLMERNYMSEEEAHRYLQKHSMDSGTDMTETAEMVLSMMERGAL